MIVNKWAKAIAERLSDEWDGKSDTKIEIKPIKIFTPEKSSEIVKNQNKDVITRDLKINGKFYQAFNEWLDKNRVE